jgi:hypothetical protein
MWDSLDLHSLVAIYTAVTLIPISIAYFIQRIAGWWMR